MASDEPPLEFSGQQENNGVSFTPRPDTVSVRDLTTIPANLAACPAHTSTLPSLIISQKFTEAPIFSKLREQSAAKEAARQAAEVLGGRKRARVDPSSLSSFSSSAGGQRSGASENPQKRVASFAAGVGVAREEALKKETRAGLTNKSPRFFTKGSPVTRGLHLILQILILFISSLFRDGC